MNFGLNYIPLSINKLNHMASYRFHFNGQEADNEVAGSGNSYTAEFWQYDSRLGRRWNVDPMTARYAGLSPYATFNNCPIVFIDPLGLEGEEPKPGEGTAQNPGFKSGKGTNDNPYEMPEVEVNIPKPDNYSQPEKNTSSLLKRIGNFISNSFNWLKNRWGIMFSSENGGKIGGARKATPGMDVDVIPFEAVEAIKLSMPWLINGNKGYKPSKPTDADWIDPTIEALEVNSNVNDAHKVSNEVHNKLIVDYKDEDEEFKRGVEPNGDSTFQVITTTKTFKGTGRFTTGYAYRKAIRSQQSNKKK
jgi:RHS repeat-associated protein